MGRSRHNPMPRSVTHFTGLICYPVYRLHMLWAPDLNLSPRAWLLWAPDLLQAELFLSCLAFPFSNRIGSETMLAFQGLCSIFYTHNQRSAFLYTHLEVL